MMSALKCRNREHTVQQRHSRATACQFRWIFAATQQVAPESGRRLCLPEDVAYCWTVVSTGRQRDSHTFSNSLEIDSNMSRALTRVAKVLAMSTASALNVVAINRIIHQSQVDIVVFRFTANA